MLKAIAICKRCRLWDEWT